MRCLFARNQGVVRDSNRSCYIEQRADIRHIANDASDRAVTELSLEYWRRLKGGNAPLSGNVSSENAPEISDEDFIRAQTTVLKFACGIVATDIALKDLFAKMRLPST
jgi:hypothetical protein